LKLMVPAAVVEARPWVIAAPRPQTSASRLQHHTLASRGNEKIVRSFALYE